MSTHHYRRKAENISSLKVLLSKHLGVFCSSNDFMWPGRQ
jgi:hypothetical protein